VGVPISEHTPSARRAGRLRLPTTVLCLAFLAAACFPARREPLPASPVGLAEQAEQAYRQSDYAEAEVFWQRALESAPAGSREAVVALLGLARLDEARGDYRSAERRAREVVDQAQRLEEPLLQAQALNTLALAERRLARFRESLDTARWARVLAQTLSAPGLEAESLKNTGAAHQAQGAFDEADTAYGRALDLALQAGDLDLQAEVLNNLGGLKRARASYAGAERSYLASLALRERLGDLRGEGKVRGNLCLLYQNLGDLERALDECERSATLARRSGDRGLEANNRNNLGAIHRARGDDDRARAEYERSLALKRGLGDRAGEARALSNLGDIHGRRGDGLAALACYQESLRIKEAIGDYPGQSAVLQNLGVLYLDQGRVEEARGAFERSLALQSTLGQPELIWRAYDGLGRAWQARQHRALAIFFGKQAVNTLQAVRADIRGLEPALQRAFLQDKAGAYRRLSDLLIEEGRLLEAQQVLTMLKEEEYFDFIRRRAADDPRETRVALTRLEVEWRARYDAVAGRLVELGGEYHALRERGGLDPPEAARLAELDAGLRAAREAHRAFLAELQAELVAAGGRRALELGEKDLRSLGAVQALLGRIGRRAVLLHYLVRGDGVRIIVTGPDPSIPPVHREARVASEELNRLLKGARDRLQDPHSDPIPELNALYRLLLAPVEADLAAYDPEVLMVSLDQALRYLPYAALYDGSRYLVERYALAMYTAAARGALAVAPAGQWRAAGLGRSAAADGFDPLPAVPRELDAIVREGEADPLGVLPGETYLDKAFTEDRLSAVLRDGFNVVHLASHFRFEPGNEDDSFLVLGGGGPLTVGELQRGDYPFAGVDLLTLSACETALGGEAADGSEVESFGALAQRQGAASVMATLWRVADESTAVFMARFYEHREARRETKAEALRQTQIALLRGVVGGAGTVGRGQVLARSTEPPERPGAGPRYSHPFFWAPFVLMGNWL
jgi:CHAT domain-containing protein/tetratricopeptide (TPR) repeat protein